MKFFKSIKTLLLPILLSFILGSGCNIKKTNDTPIERNKQLSYPAYLAGQEKLNLDTIKVIQVLESTFPPETVLQFFGPGTHAFYLVAGTVKDEKSLIYTYAKDIGITANFIPEMLLENLRNTENAGTPFNKGKVDREHIFGNISDVNAETPRTVGIYEIRIGIDKSKKVLYPWTILPLSIDKYRVHFDHKYERNEFTSNGFPRTMIGGYEELGKKILYPDEARQLGVSGKIVVSAYVDEKGNVVGTQLLRGIGFGCDDVALNAIKQSKYYPSDFGKSEVIIPIDFALEYKSSSIDLTSTQFKYDPKAKYNNIYFNVINKGSAIPPKTKVFVSLYIDKKMVAMSIMPQIKKDASFWVRWENVKKGMHEYVLYIDPENNLKETNRANNIVTGSFELR